MTVAETATGFRLVTRPDHTALAGRFADHWGNDRFEPPAPSPSVANRRAHHDDGWWARGRRPYVCDDGIPEDFTDVDPEPWISLHDSGVDDVTVGDGSRGPVTEEIQSRFFTILDGTPRGSRWSDGAPESPSLLRGRWIGRT